MRLELPHLDASDPLREIAAAMLSRPLAQLPRGPALPPIPARLWEPAPFGVEQLPAVRDASEEDRRAIVGLVARELIEQLIAGAGASQTVAARLSSLAHSAEERWLFSRRSLDQARIEAALLRFLPAPLIEDPHLSPLGVLFDRADREQTVAIEHDLSVWRSQRLSALARGCRSDGLRQTLQIAAEEDLAFTKILSTLLARAPRQRNAPPALAEVLGAFERRVLERIADVLGELPAGALLDSTSLSA